MPVSPTGKNIVNLKSICLFYITDNHFLLLQNVYTIYQSYKDGNGNWNIPKIPLVYEHNTTLKSEDCPSPSNGTFYYYSDFKWIKDIPHVYVVYDNKNDYFFLQVYLIFLCNHCCMTKYS